MFAGKGATYQVSANGIHPNVKWTLELPEHLAIADVPLDRLEELLSKHVR